MDQLILYLLSLAAETAPYFVFGVILPVFIAISAVVVTTVNKLENPERLFDTVTEIDVKDRTADTWAERNGFTQEASYRFNGNIIATFWKRGPGANYLCRYLSPFGQSSYEFVTVFNETKGLTTSSTRDALLLPNFPGAYVQCFPGVDLDALHRIHEEGKGYLESSFGVRAEVSGRSVFEAACAALRRQAAFIKTIPLWQVRGPYWYFIRRRLNVNCTVRELHPNAGMQRSPELHLGA